MKTRSKKTTRTDDAKQKSFGEVFSSHPVAVRAVAQKLRQLVMQTLPELTETAYGGAKVRLTLYSLGHPNNVVCGIQPGAKGCLLYLHHVAPKDSSMLKIEGQGKHARHIKLAGLDKVTKVEVHRLLALARSRAA